MTTAAASLTRDFAAPCERDLRCLGGGEDGERGVFCEEAGEVEGCWVGGGGDGAAGRCGGDGGVEEEMGEGFEVGGTVGEGGALVGGEGRGSNGMAQRFEAHFSLFSFVCKSV